MNPITVETLVAAIHQGARQGVENELVFEDLAVSGANEFLFFIKPELLIPDTALQTADMLGMILGKIAAFDLKIRNVRVLSATYLAKHGIIAQHYGVINRLASNAVEAMSVGAKARFEELFKVPVDEADLYGGIEFLEEFPQFTAFTLDILWQNGGCKKLAGGTYALELSIDGEAVYLVNGFHPRQLEHFTANDRCIVVASLVGDLDWTTARNDFIGKTNPLDAAEGSIRRTLLEQAEAFGLSAVNSSWNGVHLSAGPIEALVELIRYQSDWNGGEPLKPADFTFGRQLITALGEERTHHLLTNPDVTHNGQTVSVFDLTEELNADEALDLLKSLS